MHVRITSDANAESGVASIVYEISGPTRHYFAAKSYGLGLLGLVIVLMCRDPELNFRRRLRFDRKKETVLMDIMLDLTEMRNADHERRKQIVLERIAAEVPEVLKKYSISEFDEPAFVADLKSWLSEVATTGQGAQSGKSGVKATD